MRIIDYINIIAILLCIAAVFMAVLGRKKVYGQSFSGKKTYAILVVIVAVAAFLRLFRLGAVPYGLQQDEASLGYDAFCLATKGIDRNGYPFPIYPITWGCGGGSPLLIYINALVIKFFGTGVVKLRLIPAIFGIATVYLFFVTLRENFGNKASLAGAAFLAVCPWHMILSRWSLDSNVMPFFMLLAMYLLMLGVKKNSTAILCLSSVVYSLCMYCYGSANIVIPIHLVLISLYLLIKKKISVKQLVLAVLSFILVFLPLLIFYAVNYLGVPEILTGVVSFNRFTASRTGEVFMSADEALIPHIWQNLKTLVKLMTVGDEADMTCHFIPGFSTLFKFTFPVTFLGIIISITDLIGSKAEKYVNAIWLSMLLACVFLGMMIEIDISRMVMIFLPLIFFFVTGCGYIWRNAHKMSFVIGALVVVTSALFIRDYFGKFNGLNEQIFMPGYGEAVKRAYEIAGDDRPVYSTYEGLSAPFMLALYYTDYDPVKFYTTVEYKDANDEFRIARSFGNFYFGDIPENASKAEPEDTLYIVYDYELEQFSNDADYKIEDFGKYHVVYD